MLLKYFAYKQIDAGRSLDILSSYYPESHVDFHLNHAI